MFSDISCGDVLMSTCLVCGSTRGSVGVLFELDQIAELIDGSINLSIHPSIDRSTYQPSTPALIADRCFLALKQNVRERMQSYGRLNERRGRRYLPSSLQATKVFKPDGEEGVEEKEKEQEKKRR